MRTIVINKALNGYVVQVGCQTIVIEGDSKLLGELARYITSPAEVEKEWLSKYGDMGALTPADPRYGSDQCESAPSTQQMGRNAVGGAMRGGW